MNTNAQYSTSKSVRRFARWLLILLLIAIVVMGWNWAKNQGHVANLQQILTQYLNDADIFGSRTRGMIAQIDSIQFETDRRLDQLAASLLSIENQRHSFVQNDIEAISRIGSDEQVLAAVTRLVYFANHFLQLTGDTESSRAVLEQTLASVRSSKQLMNADIEAALTKDIQQLEKASHLDRTSIYQDISRSIAQIDQLPLAMNTHLQIINLPEIQTEATNSSSWLRFFAKIWQDLCQLIQIKKMDSETMVLLSPSQVQLLRGNVKLQLKQAQLALLTRDHDTFAHGLETALGLIDGYFDTQQSDVIGIQAKLNQYKEMAKEMAYPDLLASLQALQSAQMKLERGNE